MVMSPSRRHRGRQMGVIRLFSRWRLCTSTYLIGSPVQWVTATHCIRVPVDLFLGLVFTTILSVVVSTGVLELA